MRNDLIDLIDKLKDQTLSAPYDAALDYFEQFGFGIVNAALSSLSDESYFGMYSNMSSDWLDHYVDAGYPDVDPLVKRATEYAGPTLCDEDTVHRLPSLKRSLSDLMFKELPTVGMQSSLLIPKHSAVSDRMIGFNLGADCCGAELAKRFDSNRQEILVGSALLLDAILARIIHEAA